MINLTRKYFEKKKIINFYKLFNYKHFKKLESSSQILIEFNGFYSSHFFLAILASALSKKFNLSIIAYYNYFLSNTNIIKNLFNKIKWKIGKILKINFFGIYQSFGVKDFIKPELNNYNTIAEKNFKKQLKLIKTKNDLIKFSIDNVLLGDLIYDGFLKTYNRYTLNINDVNFQNYFINFLKLYYFWEDYFSKNIVKAVVGVHSYYSYGLILRLAINKKIIVLTVESGKIYRLSKTRLTANLEFKDFKKVYLKIRPKHKKYLLGKAKNSINNRFLGKISNKIDELVTTKSSFKEIFNEKSNPVIKDKKKINVLIATHNIGDVCNAYGRNFFLEFYDWLKFLGNISNHTDYDWYIKDHPYYSDLKFSKSLDRTYDLSKKITNDFKNITRIPPSTSHHQIIKEGIDYVLTIYGTISWEYAYFNIPVLTATRNCPTINYSFNIHSNDLIHYRNRLMNLSKFKKKFDKREIHEFYIMRYLWFNHDKLFKKFSSFLNDGNKNFDFYDSYFFYEYLISNTNNKGILDMEKKLLNFLNSNEYLLV